MIGREMKIQFTMKTPDVLYYGLQDIEDKDERKELERKLEERWFEYGEYLNVEFDTEKETLIVLEN